jgi:hypothetical protein
MGSVLGLLHAYELFATQIVPNTKTIVFLDMKLYSLVV